MVFGNGEQKPCKIIQVKAPFRPVAAKVCHPADSHTVKPYLQPQPQHLLKRKMAFCQKITANQHIHVDRYNAKALHAPCQIFIACQRCLGKRCQNSAFSQEVQHHHHHHGNAAEQFKICQPFCFPTCPAVFLYLFHLSHVFSPLSGAGSWSDICSLPAAGS